MKKTAVISMLCAALLLCACGIKPSDVDPPQGEEKDYFPQTYPAPSSEPSPQRYLPPK